LAKIQYKKNSGGTYKTNTFLQVTFCSAFFLKVVLSNGTRIGVCDGSIGVRDVGVSLL
jgi:hypothetical protein